MPSNSSFQESRLFFTPIRELGLTIAGTALEPVISQLQQELEAKGIHRLKPHFYLSTEWGVPFGTISIAIPFYLARPDLIALHADRIGHLEGVGRVDLLRYLRHEVGHVVSYAYKLYDQEEWIKQFGSITQPYLEEYRPEPFSRRYVRHLPGWYAQKHPEEDWAETFAVWMTPNFDWRVAYADWPEARAKLEYCDLTMTQLNLRDPDVTTIESDEDVSDISSSLEDFYRATAHTEEHPLPPGLDGALLAIFEDFDENQDSGAEPLRKSAADLILLLERDLVANIYRWTGHFPEPTRHLIQHLAHRARHLQQVYPVDCESQVVIALTTLISSLAMNHVIRGSYLP